MSGKKTGSSSLQEQALEELKHKLNSKYDYIKRLILYGSVARGESNDESDIDVLVITTQPLSRSGRHEITDVVFEINLKHGTNISTMVVDHLSWEKGPFSVLPIKEAILKEGIVL